MITTFKRSVLKSAGYIWPEIIGYFVYTAIISWIYINFNLHIITISGVPMTILATAVTLLLSFRTNSAYDRWWEARKLWGAIVNQSRHFTSQVVTLIKNKENDSLIHKEIVHRHLAYINALRMQLRDEKDFSEVQDWLSAEEFEEMKAVKNKAAYLNYRQAKQLCELHSQGLISDYNLIALQSNLEKLFDSQGGAERIKNTPFPAIYNFGTKLAYWAFIALLPFTLIEDLGYKTIIYSSIVSVVFIELHRIGIIMEDPFNNQPNDIPMTAICRNIEIDLLPLIGETEKIPPSCKPEDGVLM